MSTECGRPVGCQCFYVASLRQLDLSGFIRGLEHPNLLLVCFFVTAFDLIIAAGMLRDLLRI